MSTEEQQNPSFESVSISMSREQMQESRTLNNHGYIDNRHVINSNNVYNTDNRVDNRINNSVNHYTANNTVGTPLTEEELQEVKADILQSFATLEFSAQQGDISGKRQPGQPGTPEWFLQHPGIQNLLKWKSK